MEVTFHKVYIEMPNNSEGRSTDIVYSIAA
jgi:hypothetical protein